MAFYTLCDLNSTPLAVSLLIPRGDTTHYQFAATAPGLVAVITGSRHRYQDVWAELEKSDFHRTEGRGEEVAWFVGTLRAGDRITASGIDGWVQTEVLAARIKPAR